MKPLVTFGDPERAIRDYLAAKLTARGETATVSVGVPPDWSTASPTHVQVECDGTPIVHYPILIKPTIRVVVWSSSPTAGKALANLCMGLLLVHPGGNGVAGIHSLTGLLSTRDHITGGDLAAFTVEVGMRSIPA